MAQNEASLISGKIRELTHLIRQTRLAQAQSAAPQAEAALSEALENTSVQKVRAHVRLEALGQELARAYSEMKELAEDEKNAFAFALVPGEPPRYWVDLASFVLMVGEGDTYRFVQETAKGYSTVLESTSVQKIAKAIAEYALGKAAPQNTRHALKPPQKAQEPDSKPTLAEAQAAPLQPVVQPVLVQPLPARTDWVKLLLAFILGAFCGALGLLAAAWLQTPPILLQ